jgi:ribosomal protein L18
MEREKLAEIYKKYGLEKEDVFKHQHYTIITRSGIEKIAAIEQITIEYEVIRCEPNYVVIKAKTKQLETFGSALKGADYKSGNTTTWYVAEMAEKRAMSRAVLKTAGLYEHGFFGEDESESFKRG